MSAILEDIKAEAQVISCIDENAMKTFVFQKKLVKAQQWMNFFLTNFFKKLFFLSS